MLTADKIRGIEFQGSGIGGYKKYDVDTFIEEVASDFDAMQKRETELLERIKSLDNLIQEYRNSEDSVKTAILSAQKTGDAILREAESKAAAMNDKAVADSDALINKAKEVAQQLLDDANQQSRDIMDNATVKSKSLLEQAQSRADNIKAEADRSIASEIEYYNQLKDAVENFKQRVIHGYKTHLELVINMKNSSDTVDAAINSNPFAEKE